MDLVTRKPNLITYMAQLQDEKFIKKMENFIIEQSSEHTEESKPFTVE